MINKKKFLAVVLTFATLISCITSFYAIDAAEEPYVIRVGEDWFYSDTNASAEGWE